MFVLDGMSLNDIEHAWSGTNAKPSLQSHLIYGTLQAYIEHATDTSASTDTCLEHTQLAWASTVAPRRGSLTTVSSIHRAHKIQLLALHCSQLYINCECAEYLTHTCCLANSKRTRCQHACYSSYSHTCVCPHTQMEANMPQQSILTRCLLGSSRMPGVDLTAVHTLLAGDASHTTSSC
jgi:hypothetical protein